MGIDYINNSPKLLREWINREKSDAEIYFRINKDSLIPNFEKELRAKGFVFEISNQTYDLVPKHKDVVLPIAIKYYHLARELKKENEQIHFMRFLSFKGDDEVVPFLLEDFYSSETSDHARWFISSCIYTIRSKKYINDYLQIVSNSSYGKNRQMFILLLGKFKVEDAIPMLIELLEDEDVRLQAINALASFKRKEFRCHFERFQNSLHSGWRKYSRAALNKLDK